MGVFFVRFGGFVCQRCVRGIGCILQISIQIHDRLDSVIEVTGYRFTSFVSGIYQLSVLTIRLFQTSGSLKIKYRP